MASSLPCLHPSVASLRLLRRKPFALRLDVAPAAVLYALAVAAARSADSSRWPVSPWVLPPLVALLHGLAVLAQAWSMSWRVAVTCDAVSDESGRCCLFFFLLFAAVADALSRGGR